MFGYSLVRTNLLAHAIRSLNDATQKLDWANAQISYLEDLQRELSRKWSKERAELITLLHASECGRESCSQCRVN